jgi:hypothetical protein
MIRKKIAIIAAASLPLTGVALFGGIQAASAGGGPLLTCTALAPAAAAGPAGGVSFTDSSNNLTGISLSSNNAQTAALVVGITTTTGLSTITINKGVVQGQTLTVAGFSNTAVVASDVQPGAGVVTPDVVTLVSPLVPIAAPVKGVYAKAKAAVTVNATDGTNNTTAYDPNVTEHLYVTASSCTSSTGLPGSFAPTQVDINATSPSTNSAAGLEAPPGLLDGSINLPPIGADYVQPVSTTVGFDTAADNKLNLLSFDETYAKGVITGDYATTKGALNVSALNPMVVCTVGELASIAGTTHEAGVATGANPLVVCDSGSAPAYPAGNGLSEILNAELNPSAIGLGGDGTAIGAIYAIQVSAGGNAVL